MTLRKVRGRAIGSKKIMENLSNTAKQAAQRSDFAQISRCLVYISDAIKNGWEKSKYGSQRNYFFKRNKNVLNGINNLSEIANGYDFIQALIDGNLDYFSYGAGSPSIKATGVEGKTATGMTLTYPAVMDNPADRIKANLYVYYDDGSTQVIPGGVGGGESVEVEVQVVLPSSITTEGYGIFACEYDGVIAKCPYVIKLTPSA